MSGGQAIAVPAAQEAGHQAAIAALAAHLRGQDGAAPERVDTQISVVLIGRDDVYKLKRPLSRSFIDAGTPARRAALCFKELAVNQAAGALYRGVVAVTAEGPPRPVTRADATALDHAVWMARFAQADRLDQWLAAGRLGPAQMVALAGLLARAHGAAERARDGDLAGQITRNAHSILGELTARHRDTLGAAPLAVVEAAVGQALAAAQPLLAARSAAGRRRACHGDLHLENLVMIQGQPLPFDAIEFNDDLRFLDPWMDLALTAMDLAARGHADLAQALARAYGHASGDPQGAALLPLYGAVRALVRALVAADTAPDQLPRARSLLTLAHQILAQPRWP